MSTWSFYSLSTGLLCGAVFSGPERCLGDNTPTGHGAFPGDHDHRRVRVDLDTGALVPHTPPAPEADEWQTWAWDATGWRWVGMPTPAAVQRKARAETIRQVEALEAAQHRPLRELMLDPENAEARARVLALDQQIAELRAELAAPSTAGA